MLGAFFKFRNPGYLQAKRQRASSCYNKLDANKQSHEENGEEERRKKETATTSPDDKSHVIFDDDQCYCVKTDDVIDQVDSDAVQRDCCENHVKKQDVDVAPNYEDVIKCIISDNGHENDKDSSPAAVAANTQYVQQETMGEISSSSDEIPAAADRKQDPPDPESNTRSVSKNVMKKKNARKGRERPFSPC